jgi:F420-0:gamma-glutamyl ligase-like protein
MKSEHLVIVLVIVGVAIWLVPAFVYSAKLLSTDEFEPNLRKQLLVYLWIAPIIGAVMCVVMFSKIGKLRKLSQAEHKSLWAAHNRR